MEIALTGDWHIDGNRKQYQFVKRVVASMPDQLILMGDMIDSGISGGMNWDQENVTKQLRQFMKITEDKTILGYVLGNHEFRINRLTGLNIYDSILGKEKQTYRIDNRIITVEHGSRAPQDQAKQVKELALIHPKAHVCALGHTHGLMVQLSNEYQWLLRTGHLQLYPDYARRKIITPSPLGYIRYDTTDSVVNIVRIK